MSSADELLRTAREELLTDQGQCDRSQYGNILRLVSAHFDYLAGEIDAAAARGRTSELCTLAETHAEMVRFFAREVLLRASEAEALRSRLAALESSDARNESELAQIKATTALRLKDSESSAAGIRSELAQIKGTTAWRWLNRYGVIKHRYLLPLMRRFGAGKRE